MQFKEYLAEKRLQKRIPVRVFARLVGISPSYLCDLESGHRSFPSDPSKAKELFDKMIAVLELSNEEAAQFKLLADQSTLENGKLSGDIREYLLHNPQAQLALRKAKEKGISDEIWAALIKKIEEEN